MEDKDTFFEEYCVRDEIADLFKTHEFSYDSDDDLKSLEKTRPTSDNVIAFIPARGGSKSIPLKNIKLFCGKPLIYWVIEELQKCNYVSRIVVSTDSNEIESCIDDMPDVSKVSVFKRSAETATDTASTESAILEFLNSDSLSDDERSGYLMLVQATSPLTIVDDFNNGIELLINNGFRSVLSGVNTKRFHWSEMNACTHIAKPLDYDPTERPRRQDYNGSFIENGAFYISSIQAILESGCRISGDIGMYAMPEYTLHEIDEPSDWVILERIALSQKRFKLPMPLEFFFDVDGVLTDGKFGYSSTGKSEKYFNCKDGEAINTLKTYAKCHMLSAENNAISVARAKDLDIDFTFVDKSIGETKFSVVKDKYSVSPDSVCYIGDSDFDISLLSKCKYAFCPSDATESIKALPNIIQLKSKGGEGCIAEMLTYFV